MKLYPMQFFGAARRGHLATRTVHPLQADRALLERLHWKEKVKVRLRLGKFMLEQDNTVE